MRAHDAPDPAMGEWPVRFGERNKDMKRDIEGLAVQQTRLSQSWTIIVNGGLTGVPGWEFYGRGSFAYWAMRITPLALSPLNTACTAIAASRIPNTRINTRCAVMPIM